MKSNGHWRIQREKSLLIPLSPHHKIHRYRLSRELSQESKGENRKMKRSNQKRNSELISTLFAFNQNMGRMIKSG